MKTETTSTYNKYNSNAVKGFYILLIIIGHNKIITNSIEGLMSFLYIFHVIGFFLLPILYEDKTKTAIKLITQISRLSYIYVIFCILYGVIFSIIIKRNLNVDISSWLSALISGNANELKNVFGVQLLWFLPAFISFLALRFVAKTHKYCLYLLFTISIIAHFNHESIYVNWLYKLPFNTGIALYLFYIATIFSHLKDILNNEKKWIAPVVLILLFPAVIYGLVNNYTINIATADFLNSKLFLLTIIYDIFAIFVFIWLSQLSANLKSDTFISKIGKYSLGVYLLHSLIFYTLYEGIKRLSIEENLIYGIVVFFLTIAISYYATIIIYKLNIGKLIFLKFQKNSSKT